MIELLFAKKQTMEERESKKARGEEPLLRYNLHEPLMDMAALFGPSVTRVLLTTMNCDVEWLREAFPLAGRQACLCARDELVVPKGWTFVRAVAGEYGVPHGKLMLLQEGEEAVTVVVTTANLVPTDYTKRSNAFWSQRFATRRRAEGPRRPIGFTRARNDFGEVLLDYLERLGIPAEWTQIVAALDMTDARAVLVSSVPGMHTRADAWNYGQGRLQRLLQVEGREGRGPLLAQVTSVGYLTPGFVAQLSMALGGPLELVWPSVETVRAGQNGYEDGLHICLTAKNSAQARRLFRHQYISRPPQASPHIKSFFRLAQDAGEHELQFLYCGSHNLSRPAWGERRATDRALEVMSFEIGVLFFPRLLQRERLFFEDFALPFEFPAVPFEGGGGEPWVWDVAHDQPDRFGHTYGADMTIN